jgi:hypothetical protein
MPLVLQLACHGAKCTTQTGVQLTAPCTCQRIITKLRDLCRDKKDGRVTCIEAIESLGPGTLGTIGTLGTLGTLSIIAKLHQIANQCTFMHISYSIYSLGVFRRACGKPHTRADNKQL